MAYGKGHLRHLHFYLGVCNIRVPNFLYTYLLYEYHHGQNFESDVAEICILTDNNVFRMHAGSFNSE